MLMGNKQQQGFKISTLIITSCILVTSYISIAQKSRSYDDYKLSETALEEWRKGKNGCSFLRNRFHDSVIGNSNLIGLTEKKVSKLFGKPDAKRKRVFYYVMGAECDQKGKPIVGQEYCSFVFLYNNERKLERIFLECM